MSIGSNRGSLPEMPKITGNFECEEEGKLELSVSGSRGETNIRVKIAAKHIKPEGLGKKKRNLKGEAKSKRVTIKVLNKRDGAVYEVSVKAKHLAKELKVESEAIISGEKNGNLNGFIIAKLGGCDSQGKPVEMPVLSFSSMPKHAGAVPAIPAAPSDLKKRFGLRKEEYKVISTFYKDYHNILISDLNKTTHIRASEIDPPLPRSVVYVPSGPRKGLYILCKTKGGVKEVGLGSFNLATKMLHIDTGEEKIFRNGRKEHVSEREIRANEEFKKIDPPGKGFAAGEVVRYTGPWTARGLGGKRKLNQVKSNLPREGNVEKIGFIMDLIPGGELFDMVSRNPINRIQTPKENIKICLDIARFLVVSHAAGLVNLDIKPQNIFMSGPKNLKPIIGDFGMVYNVGDVVTNRLGTRGYLSPEILSAKPHNPLVIEAKNEMWIMGCMMAITTKGFDFNSYIGQSDGDLYRVLSQGKQLFDVEVPYLFPEYKTEGSMDYAIFKCLSWNPKDRLSAAELVPILQNLYDTA